MPNTPANTTDTIGLSARTEIDAAVSTLARILGEAAAREWVATQDRPSKGIHHDKASQNHTAIDGA